MEVGKVSVDRNSKSECFPIDNYDDVLKWTRPESSWVELVEPLMKRTQFCLQGYPTCRTLPRTYLTQVPKTLVCHDMKGGYLNDRFTEGHCNLDDYKFLSWPSIDIFVYFSHHFLTIPPLAWINAGHLHGVKVLGTILTEGEKGSLDWKQILSNRHATHTLARNMAFICQFYKFDGYLLNIENTLDIDHVQGPLMYFIKTLNNLLKSFNPGNLLIWYDAVTTSGLLKWQNSLNGNNGAFFKLCDGIFLNYAWNENLLASSAAFAGDRLSDVYVGIDVFGRGVFGGGGFSSNKAFEVIRKYKLSAAVFAPGWVHENCGERENPDARDFTFWKYISPYLYSYGPSQLPFQTSFCRGYGYKTYLQGMVVGEVGWFNQSKLNYLPGQLCGITGLEEDSCFRYYQGDGFSGGGCLLISRNPTHQTDIYHTDCLLTCDFCSSSGTVGIELYMKPVHENDTCGMDLIVTTMKPGENTQTSSTSETSHKTHTLSVTATGDTIGNNWYRSKFQLVLGEEHILDIGLSRVRSPTLLGLLNIYPL